jgi:hypothetical protein
MVELDEGVYGEHLVVVVVVELDLELYYKRLVMVEWW